MKQKLGRSRSDHSPRTSRKSECGFATICVLMLATAIFCLLTLVLSSTYELRNENRRLADEIQKRAHAGHVADSQK